MTKQERAVRTRQALIRSAAEVFDAEGFASSSITEISSRAGVSNGALHFHFANKNALAEKVEEVALGELRRILMPWHGDGAPSFQRLVDATHLLAERLQGDVILRAGFGLSADATWNCRADLRRYWVDWTAEALTVLEKEGALADGVRPEDALAVIAATTVGLEALARSDPQWVGRSVSTRLWRLLLPRLTAAHLEGTVRAEGSSPLSPAH
ncbi:ScbR family autoregulator-binding transcription factor [Streptomyces sp. NPDC057638]|uniref:ScbR family autoregulator-binding transcription factor n=1 Tax=Streptomyces sp. NPDC057638 TaxID=3346190 RepID=UPI0036ADDCD1